MIKRHIAYNYRWQFTIKKAKGSYLWDHNGRKLIDFTSGWNVTNLGWNHPEIAEAMIAQIKKNVYVPVETGEEIQYELAQTLTDSLPKELTVVTRATGGAEANEEAMKIARATTGRKKILGFYDAYHGQTLGDLSIGIRKQYLTKFSPSVPEFIHLEFPTTFLTRTSEKETLDIFLNKLENILKKRDVAAVVTEPGMITGWGSTYVAPKGFLKGLRKLTQDYGTLLILDEVGTGFSRTGKLFGMQHESVVPDIVTFAKAMSNGGAAIGAAVYKREIVDPAYEEIFLGSTFGWTPVACAAALATLKVHLRDKLWEQSHEKGTWLKKELAKRLGDHPKVGDIRGMGMEIGLVFVKNKKTLKPDTDFADRVCQQALKNNLYLTSGDEGSVQLMPPLLTPQHVLEDGLDIIEKSIERAIK